MKIIFDKSGIPKPLSQLFITQNYIHNEFSAEAII